MKDETALPTIDAQTVINLDSSTLTSDAEKKAAKMGYRLGHTLGFSGGWAQGYDEGESVAGWKAKAEHYLIPAAMGGAMVGWLVFWATHLG